jgi:hypothetical protein
MRHWPALLVAAALAASSAPGANGFEGNGCERQRADYPKRWNDIGKEKLLFTCAALDKSWLRVRLGATDGKGRSLISVEATEAGKKKNIYRMWLDREQTERLRQGAYFGTVLRSEQSCWIRSLDEDTKFLFMDRAPAQPGDDVTPRISTFEGVPYSCAAANPPPPPPTKTSCEQQRAQYPKNWNDVSQDKPLLHCWIRGDNWKVRLGEPNSAGRSMLSLVRMRWIDPTTILREDSSFGVSRAWLDSEQAQRLKQGGYFATVIREDDETCWDDGEHKQRSVFFMDNTDDPPDRSDAGSFYNKAPRFGVFGGALYCKPVKDGDP